MTSISPTSPLLTLAVEPTNGSSTQQLLAQFHPIMKSLGFGNFEKEAEQMFIASKPGKGVFGSDLYVFAEVSEGEVIINIDGHSIFGLKGVEEQLKCIKGEYENKGDATVRLHGPNYLSSFLGNFLYTALPLYGGATIAAGLLYNFGMDRQGVFNVFLYATMGAVSGKTRYWVEQRRKNRSVLKSTLILFIAAPTIIAVIVLIGWAISEFG